MNNGIVVPFQDNSAHGEDTFLTRELSRSAYLDVVLDGLTHCEGAYASGFTCQLLETNSIDSVDDVIATLKEANKTLFQGGQGRSLFTTASATLKLGDELHVVNVGDSPIYLIRGGEAREISDTGKPINFPSMIQNVVGLREELHCEYQKLTLESGDWIILATDGITNNLFPEELARIIGDAATPDKASEALQELLSERRRLHRGREDSYGTFREDDRTAIIRYFD